MFFGHGEPGCSGPINIRSLSKSFDILFKDNNIKFTKNLVVIFVSCCTGASSSTEGDLGLNLSLSVIDYFEKNKTLFV